MISVTEEDAMKVVEFLNGYILRLRYTKNMLDGYRADAIEDLVQRLNKNIIKN